MLSQNKRLHCIIQPRHFFVINRNKKNNRIKYLFCNTEGVCLSHSGQLARKEELIAEQEEIIRQREEDLQQLFEQISQRDATIKELQQSHKSIESKLQGR